MSNKQILTLWLQSFQTMYDGIYYRTTLFDSLAQCRALNKNNAVSMLSELLENNPGIGPLTICEFHLLFMQGRIKT